MSHIFVMFRVQQIPLPEKSSFSGLGRIYNTELSETLNSKHHNNVTKSMYSSVNQGNYVI